MIIEEGVVGEGTTITEDEAEADTTPHAIHLKSHVIVVIS